jgi:hypothetical protein
MRPDDDLDGCELDFKENPTVFAQAQALLKPKSRDRTEAQEEERARKALRKKDGKDAV